MVFRRIRNAHRCIFGADELGLTFGFKPSFDMQASIDTEPFLVGSDSSIPGNLEA